MALILRIDVDRPYGKQPFLRHVLSRLGSDFSFPRVETFGYLKELRTVLLMLNEAAAKAYIFFRRCTMPSPAVLHLMRDGGHIMGLHLENSRSFSSFLKEKTMLEDHIGEPIFALSKHGSGGEKHGLYHFSSYEPDKYLDWARQAGMKLFLGNMEDPSLKPSVEKNGFSFFPSAFWLEPSWRRTDIFTIDWLLNHAKSSYIVLLIHPENLLADPCLLESFRNILQTLETQILK